MSAVYKKEMRTYFRSALGWVIVALFLLFSGVSVLVFNMMLISADFFSSLSFMRISLILIVPLLTMRSIAEDRHNGTDKLYFSLPLRTTQIVLGKFFAMLTVFALPTLLSCLYPMLLSFFGEVNLSSAYTALLGYFLMGVALIALCTLISSFADNQLVAGAISLVVCLLLFFLDTVSRFIPAAPMASMIICVLVSILFGFVIWRISKNLAFGCGVSLAFILVILLLYFVRKSLFSMLIPNTLILISPFGRMIGFCYGYMDLGAIVLYLSITLLCLFFTVQSMDARRRA